MVLLTLAVGATAAVLLLPTLSDFISAIWARGYQPEAELGRNGRELPSLVFIIPAHDEEAVIGDCVHSIAAMDYPDAHRRVVVIADNCTDGTPAVARTAGAECFERHDADYPGKPRAIAWALDRIDLSQCDAVVIIDADTVVAPDFASELVRQEPLDDRAVQAYCGVRNPRDTPLTRMAAVLATARYDLAYPLKEAAGLNVPLMGNGMCFGSGVLQTHGWKAFSICEDWEMYAILTAAGVPIRGSPRARLFAEEARSLRQSQSQRQRWAAGKLTVLAGLAWPISRSPYVSWRQKLDSFAELTHIGPAAHLGLVGMLVAGSLLLRIPGAWWLSVALLVSVVRVVAYTLLALARESEPMSSLRAFAYLPFYTVWRLGVQLSALAMLGDKPWVKTERNE